MDTNYSFSYQSKLKCVLEEINTRKIRLYSTWFSANENKREKVKKTLILEVMFSLLSPSWMLKLPIIPSRKYIQHVYQMMILLTCSCRGLPFAIGQLCHLIFILLINFLDLYFLRPLETKACIYMDFQYLNIQAWLRWKKSASICHFLCAHQNK